MEHFEATFRIVTPMFIGSAGPNPDDGIRPPSIKGALRFWWRALNWGPIRLSANGDADALRQLHAEESRLFGSTEKGQGLFLLRVQTQPDLRSLEKEWPKGNTGAGYLSFGILESKGGNSGKPQPHRQGIQEGQEFKLHLLFKPGTIEADRASVQAALLAWGRLGGLGGRARRGHGSVALTTLNGEGMLLSQSAYLDWLNALIDGYAGNNVPPFTAFSSATVLRVFDEAVQPRDAMEQAGNHYKSHRFVIKQQGASRIGFGLPLVGVNTQDRRASPLLFHIHPLSRPGEKEKYLPLCLYMPATPFHPGNRQADMAPVQQFVQGGAA